jgi:hypothetical protein
MRGVRRAAGVPARALLMAVVAAALPSCADPAQALLCPPGCRSREHAPGARRVGFPGLRGLKSLSLPLPSLPSLSASLLVYLSALRGIRGGASAVAAPSDFSHFGLSDLAQTSTAAPDRDLRGTSAGPGVAPSAVLGRGPTNEDLYNMKLLDLQRALRLRGLSTRGLKSDLVERLHLHSADPTLATDELSHARAIGKRDRRHGEGELAGPDVQEAGKGKRARLPADEVRRRRKAGDLSQKPDDLFKVFRTQREAFNFSDARPEDGLQVYSQDKCSTGEKLYIVATLRV